MTKHFRILLFILCGFVAIPATSHAQTPTPSYQQQGQQRQLTPAERAQIERQNEEAAKAVGGACTVCGGGIATMGLVFVVLVALNIALLIWVARDAKSRGMDSSILWMFLVMFTSVVGLVIYLFSRPQGELIQCPYCKGQRLKVSATCPHCHHA